MSRRPRAAEPSPPARRRNETYVKVDRGNPFWRGGRAADGRRGRRRRRWAPKVPRHPPPPPPLPPVRGWLAARRRPPPRAPLRTLSFTVAPEGQKKGGLVGSGAPRPGHGDTGDLREHHGHRTALLTDLRSSRKRPGTVGWAAVVAPSPHAAVPVLPRGLEEGRVPTGDRLPPVPLRSSLPASGSDSPLARRTLACPGELRAAPENSAGRSSGSPGRGQGNPPAKSGRGASLASGQQAVTAGTASHRRLKSGGSQRRYGEQRKAEGGGDRDASRAGTPGAVGEASGGAGNAQAVEERAQRLPPARSPAFPLRNEPQSLENSLFSF
ncbi:translation initiation factor IF-2-like [Vidua chalybeata]|uniref:translation initiation factor IF-2-like n=1 Tax=Vidua chalybeata TaxID=81927 RepID=UPI0023A86591|nr:translation initiation factor IF-2-like [Vidua chalybeata]